MQATSLLPCLWPGLPRLWQRGDWWALLTAIGFALLLNGAVVCTFAWTNWLPTWVTYVGWTVIATAWTMSIWREYHRLPMVQNERYATGASLLARAQQEYLTGDWFETETLLQQILKDDCDDVDARLMLATLYRRTGRLEEAAVCLGQLERMERADKWSLEISRERNLLSDLGSKSETDRNGSSVRHSEPDR
jgi:hypothetical protein